MSVLSSLSDLGTRAYALALLATKVGPTSRYGRQSNALVRYRMLEALASIGLFDYLRQPRTYEDVLNTYSFVDTPYTRDVFKALSDPKKGVLVQENGTYRLVENFRLPPWEEFSPKILPVIRNLEFAQQYAQLVPLRMRGEDIPLAERLEKERNSLLKFDDTLTNRIYDGLRIVSYAWARPLLGDVTGKTLLDVGCGSGRETAHLWVLFEGKARIVSVDPVQAFVDMAQERFPHYVQELAPERVEYFRRQMEVNPPEFAVMSAEDLRFPDASVNYIFHSQMLHWTSDVRTTIRELLRVLKPGGVIFGSEVCKPTADIFLDLMFRISDNIAGTVWLDDLINWYAENGATFENLAVGIHRGRKNGA
ncbi:MAG: hypothetical protein Kow0077_23210 [Anaerolineae bacterium]